MKAGSVTYYTQSLYKGKKDFDFVNSGHINGRSMLCITDETVQFIYNHDIGLKQNRVWLDRSS